MGLTILLGTFYRPLTKDEGRGPVLGQFAWVPVPEFLEIPRILDVARNNPRSHESADAVIRNVTTKDFRRRGGLPVYKLTLGDHEELLIQKAKRRLAIVVAQYGTAFSDVDAVLRSAGKKHLQERNVIVAPLYGVQGPDHPRGFPEIMCRRIDALMYSQFFYCPANKLPEIYEGVARLDRLIPVVPKDPAAYEPLPVALSDESLSVLMAQLRLRFDSKQEPEIETLREVLADTVPVNLRPPSVAPQPVSGG